MPVPASIGTTLLTPRREWNPAFDLPTVWDVVLRDGTHGHVRRIGPEDRPGVEDFVARLSPRSLRERFFAAMPPASAVAQLADPGTHEERLLLGLFVGPGDGQRLIGHAVYARDEPEGDSAEAAFIVDDAFQGRGSATTLLACLAESAAERGVTHLRAVVQSGQWRMLEVFRGSGYPLEEVSLGAVTHVRLSTRRTEAEHRAGAEVRAVGRCRIRRAVAEPP